MSAPKSHISRYSGIARPVLLALGVVLIIYISFEIAEWLWLRELLDESSIHLLHLSRGIISSLVAALLVSWLIVRASPSLFSSSSEANENPEQIIRRTEQDRIVNFTRWFILMRWIAIVVAGVLTWLVVRILEWLPQEVWWPLIITIAVLVMLNLVYEYAFRKSFFPRDMLQFQAYADLVILVVLLHYSGGLENPLSLLMLLHVIIAGIILNRRHCYAVATAASGLLALVATGEATGILNHYTLAIFPHAEHEGGLAHASLQPFFVISYVGLLTVIFFLTAYFVTTLSDQLRRGEQQLEQLAAQAVEQRQLIEKALETTNTGLCVCNREGEPYWTNQRWESWFGFHSIDTFAANHGLQETKCLCKVLGNGESHVNEISLTKDAPPGKEKTYLITTAPLHGKEGRSDHAVSLAQDITEQKKSQDQLIRAGKLAAVGELAGHVAHEVNNPIGVISAKGRLLKSDYSEEMSDYVQQELDKMINAADRVAHIARGLLTYCRPTFAEQTQLDIRHPIREALSLIEQRAHKQRVEIEDKISDSLPPVKANADEMQQIFLNLFLNALDAMPEGGTLTVSAHSPEQNGDSGEQNVTISIGDTGNGIPEEIQEQVFEPFYTTKQDGQGTGLGLSICAGIIRSHEGNIDVESKPQQGSVFSISLPAIKQNTVKS